MMFGLGRIVLSIIVVLTLLYTARKLMTKKHWRRRTYIFGAVAFALTAMLFVVILLGPDRYSKDGYGWMVVWALAMSGVNVFLARREGVTSRRQ